LIKHRLAVGSLLCLLIASVPGLRAQEPASIFITLGTQAGPGADKLRSQPASLLIAGDQIILIDAGDGAAEQLAKVDVPLAKIRTILISHTHFDHIGGLFALLGMRYQTQTSERLTIYGPPGIKRVVEGLIEAMRASVVAKANMRGGKPDDTIDIREIGDGSTVSLGPIRITVAENSHYSATFDAGESTERSLSYRFALADRTIVYTGDTGPSENVERLAAGVDLLVSEVVDPAAAMARIEEKSGGGVAFMLLKPVLARHMAQEHLSPENVGRLAAKAGVKRLVLTHIQIGQDGFDEALAAIKAHYKGPVVFAEDLGRY